MDNNGFTLIELLATIAVMGVLMAVAFPNIVSMIDKGKGISYVNDARKLVTLAKYKLEGNSMGRPSSTGCVKYNISMLDMSDLQSGPFDGIYNFSDGNYSFVVVRYNSSKKVYEYYVQLVEQFTTGGKTYYRGIKYTESTLLFKENAKVMYVTNSYDNLSTFRTYNSFSC